MLSRFVRSIQRALGRDTTQPTDYAALPVTDIRIDIPDLDSAVPPSDDTTMTAWNIVTSLGTIVFAPENRFGIISASVLTSINTALSFVAPYLLGQTIEAANKEEDTETLLLMLIAAGILADLVPNLRYQVLATVTSNIRGDLVTKITAHQLEKSLDYHSKTQFSEQSYLLQRGLTTSYSLTPLLTSIAPTLFEIAMAVGVLSYRYGVGMGAGIAGTAAIFTAYSASTTQSIFRAKELMIRTSGESWNKMTNALSQYKNIHDFVKYSHEMRKINIAVKEAMEAEILSITTPLKIGLGHIAIPRLGMLAACLYIAGSMNANHYTAQDLLLFFNYLDKLSMLLPNIGLALNNFLSAYPDLKYVFTELNKPSEIVDPYPHVELHITQQAPEIRFENVTFAYPNKAPLFKHLSFSVGHGETVALVSQSGGGKSTLFKLLYGYNTPLEGKIYINDQDTSEVSLKSLQSQIGLIGQTPSLFNASVRDNIRYGAPDPDAITDAQIWEMAERANLADFLRSLDRGYDIVFLHHEPQNNQVKENVVYVYLDNQQIHYAVKLGNNEMIRAAIKDEILSPTLHTYLEEIESPILDHDIKNALLDLLLSRHHILDKRLDNSVGHEGKAFSGGEQQRVAILRGLFKETPIRLLDEITSALDSVTADQVLVGIRQLHAGKTQLMITHKLAEAQVADKIIVLANGGVLAQGTHAELLESCSLYQSLWETQSAQSRTPTPPRSPTQTTTLLMSTLGTKTGEENEKVAEASKVYGNPLRAKTVDTKVVEPETLVTPKKRQP